MHVLKLRFYIAMAKLYIIQIIFKWLSARDDAPFSNINQSDLKIYPENMLTAGCCQFCNTCCWESDIGLLEACYISRLLAIRHLSVLPAVGQIACWRILDSKCCKNINGPLLAGHSIVWPFLRIRARGHTRPMLQDFAICQRITRLHFYEKCKAYLYAPENGEWSIMMIWK